MAGPLARHVTAAIATGRGVVAQARFASSPGSPADHVRRAEMAGRGGPVQTRFPAARQSTIQLTEDPEADEASGNPGFWYTGEKRPIQAFLYADCHMGDYGSPPVEPLKLSSVKGAMQDKFGASKGSIVRIQYMFGSWNVFVPWPTVWILRGQAYYPGPNRYGFVPSAEFGLPTFWGETAINEKLGTVKPFAYATAGGSSYTPEVDFIFGESISSTKLGQLIREARDSSVQAAVKKVLGR